MHKWKCNLMHIPLHSYLSMSGYWRNMDEAFVGVFLCLHAVSIPGLFFLNF